MDINPYNVAAGTMGPFTRAGTFGFNDDIGTAEETVWSEGGVYSYLSTGEPLTISSDSTADAAAGVGARTVEVSGLNQDFIPINEIVSLNGQSGVTTANSYVRVFRLTVLTGGSSGGNVGKIYAGTGALTAGVPANIFSAVPIGKNQSSMCIWTVPANARAFLTGVFTCTQKNASNTATIRVIGRSPGQVFQTKGEFIISQPGGPILAPFTLPLPLPEKTDIEVRAVASAANTDVSAAMVFMVGP